MFWAGYRSFCTPLKVSEWCDLRVMKLNARKTKTIIVSMSCTMHLQSPKLTIGRSVLKESDDHDILGMIFDSKMTLERHLRPVTSAASQRLVILRKSQRVFHDRLLLGRCFLCFLQYFSAVWCSAADTHHKLLDLLVSQWCYFFNWRCALCDIAHQRSVAVQCMLYKIMCNPMHPLYGALP